LVRLCYISYLPVKEHEQSAATFTHQNAREMPTYRIASHVPHPTTRHRHRRTQRPDGPYRYRGNRDLTDHYALLTIDPTLRLLLDTERPSAEETLTTAATSTGDGTISL
jgi:hypothetical protein